MIFPQTINGYIAFLHRIQPNIQIAYFEDIEHLLHPEPDYWERHMRELGKHNILSPKYTWERKKIGAGPPPVLTEAGWLLIYHGVDDDSVYRVGAALLDEKNPYRVIARFPSPILEPVRDYEQFGDVNMVVFPEGVVQDGDQLQIYYGCADKVIGLAVCSLKDILTELWKYKI